MKQSKAINLERGVTARNWFFTLLDSFIVIVFTVGKVKARAVFNRPIENSIFQKTT